MKYENYCLPVERDQRGFILSPEWLECDLPFPARSELKRKLRKPHEVLDDYVYISGEFQPARIYIFLDDQEIPLAILDSSSRQSREATEVQSNFTSYLAALKNKVAFTEYVIPEQRTRLDAVFIQPHLSLTDKPRSKHFFLSSIEDKPRVFITGPAGAGKTTILRYFVKTHAEAGLSDTNAAIPVYIQCRKFYDRSDFREALFRQIQSLSGERVLEQFSSLSAKGQLWFAFDGIDEVPLEHRAKFVETISNFVAMNNRCKFLVTSRWASTNILDDSFLKISIDPFDDKQILEFTYHKLHASNMWRSFLERVKEEKEVAELVGNPLALGLLLARYLRKEHTPLLMTEVLSDVIDLFVDQWDSRRGIVRSINGSLSAKIVYRVLSRIAEYLEEKNVSEFNLHEVQSTLDFILEQDRGSDVLDEIGTNTTLIRKNKNGRWCFTHRPVQEYLSAVSQVDKLSSEVMPIVKLLRGNRIEIEGRRFRYLLGSASDATEVVNKTIKGLTPKEKDHLPLYILNQAMAERVSIDPNTAKQFSKITSNFLEIAFKKLVALEVNFDLSPDVCMQIKGESATSEHANHFQNLLISLRSLRDGSLSERVTRSIESSDNLEVRKLAKIIQLDGVFQKSSQEGQNAKYFQIELVRERMDLS